MSLLDRILCFLELAKINIEIDRIPLAFPNKSTGFSTKRQMLMTMPRFCELMKKARHLKLNNFREANDLKFIDQEELHITEDELKNEFISQLAINAISRNDICKIAQALHQVTNLEYERWYS